ncbi:LytR/AlgR family response regulator transcription factor [Alkalihalobacillus trypoxylicola]|uniref:LytR/AlgR family response regulator transcription factor n=1 Tax=Alkalihalobacillus trypoxylicola TaxID=519424 RepID=UPI00078393C5
MITSTMRALIVDDEKYSREELIYLLKSHSQIEVIGQASTGQEAVAKMIELKPDVLFLDIEMPGMSGTEVAAVIKEMKQPPFIIFATAYPQFAIEAFQVQAKGYLLKPIDEDQLAETVTHLLELRGKSMINEPTEYTNNSKLAVENEGSILFIEPEQILYVYRDVKNTKIVSAKGTFEIKMTLKELESRLLAFSFFRVHKSYLVNTHYITEMKAWFNGAYILSLQGCEEEIPVSRNYVKPLRAQIEL